MPKGGFRMKYDEEKTDDENGRCFAMNVEEMTLKDLGVTCEFVDAIVAAKMVEQYYDIKRDIAALKIKSFDRNLAQYEKEDLEDNERLLDATETMLKYFTPQDQWEKIMGGKSDELI
jgi:hypothetical protein